MDKRTRISAHTKWEKCKLDAFTISVKDSTGFSVLGTQTFLQARNSRKKIFGSKRNSLTLLILDLPPTPVPTFTEARLTLSSKKEWTEYGSRRTWSTILKSRLSLKMFCFRAVKIRILISEKCSKSIKNVWFMSALRTMRFSILEFTLRRMNDFVLIILFLIILLK